MVMPRASAPAKPLLWHMHFRNDATVNMFQEHVHSVLSATVIVLTTEAVCYQN